MQILQSAGELLVCQRTVARCMEGGSEEIKTPRFVCLKLSSTNIGASLEMFSLKTLLKCYDSQSTAWKSTERGENKVL